MIFFWVSDVNIKPKVAKKDLPKCVLFLLDYSTNILLEGSNVISIDGFDPASRACTFHGETHQWQNYCGLCNLLGELLNPPLRAYLM